MKLLLEELKDADVDARYQFRTPIFPAAQRNHCEAVRILLNAGADVNVRDSSGQNVLLALASEKPEKKVRVRNIHAIFTINESKFAIK